MARLGIRDRIQHALGLRALARNLAIEGAKFVALLGVREVVKRIRAGPLAIRITAPWRSSEGDDLTVDVQVESPFALTRLECYHAGAWVPAKSLSPGLRRELWSFRAHAAGLRPVIVRARDVEGHALTRTHWVWIERGSGERLPQPVRVELKLSPRAD